MNWLTLISLLIRLVIGVVEYLNRRSSVATADAARIVKALEKADDLATAARNARAAVSDEPADIVSDPNNRDKQPVAGAASKPGTSGTPSGV